MKKLLRNDVTEQAGNAEDETRRQALKRFGRYAAIVPTAMLLLDPRHGHAYGRGRGREWGWGRGRGRGLTRRPHR